MDRTTSKFPRKYRFAIFIQGRFFRLPYTKENVLYIVEWLQKLWQLIGGLPEHNHPKTTMITGTKETWARQATLRIFMKKKFLHTKVTISQIQCNLLISNCWKKVPNCLANEVNRFTITRFSKAGCIVLKIIWNNETMNSRTIFPSSPSSDWPVVFILKEFTKEHNSYPLVIALLAAASSLREWKSVQ